MENRIETLRTFIDELLKNKKRGNLWFVERHMYSVSTFAAMIAKKRNLNPEISTIIGLLHDIHTLLADDSVNHAALGCLKAKEMLIELNIVSDEELEIISCAIKNHSAKAIVHDVYSELIKDADVMSHYFFNTSLSVVEGEKERLESLFHEFGLNAHS